MNKNLTKGLYMETKKIKVLVAEDDKQIITSYKEWFADFDLTVVENGKLAIEELSKNKFHVLVTDFNMPEANGLDVINFKIKKSPETLAILVSGQLDTSLCVELANKRVMLVDKTVSMDIIYEKIINLHKEYLSNQETLRNAVVGRTANQYMHDVANSVSVIGICAEIALRGKLSDDQKDDKFKRINKSVVSFNNSSRIYKNKISGMAELELSQVSVLDFFENVAEDLSAICQEHGFEYKQDFSTIEENQFMIVEPTMFKLAILNLFKNSVDANKNNPEKWVEIRVENDGESMLIHITDSGKSLKPEISSKLFQEGFTTKGKDGTGMGLVNCKSSIESFMGKIDYDKTCENVSFCIKLSISIMDDDIKKVA